MIPLSKPDITQSEINRVTAVLNSQYLSGGPVVTEFEAKLAAIAGTRFAVAVSSGTAALHLILLALGIGPGDEVVTTPYSFIASANSILYVGATPVFCDISPADLNIDPERIAAKITPRTKAILAVHVFGFPAAMDAIMQIAAARQLPVIEDACEALGAKTAGRPVGGIGIAGTFAFYPNKQITTGEGGAIVTNDSALAGMIRSLANQGRDYDNQWLRHVRLGYNYRLSELAAALGCAQLERLDPILKQRAAVAEWYYQELSGEPLLTVPDPGRFPQNEVSWFVYVVRFASHPLREHVSNHLTHHGIQNRPYFPAIHLQPFYETRFGYAEGVFPNTETAAATSLALPFCTRMTQSEVKTVGDQIRNALATYRPQ